MIEEVLSQADIVYFFLYKQGKASKILVNVLKKSEFLNKSVMMAIRGLEFIYEKFIKPEVIVNGILARNAGKYYT